MSPTFNSYLPRPKPPLFRRKNVRIIGNYNRNDRDFCLNREMKGALLEREQAWFGVIRASSFREDENALLYI